MRLIATPRFGRATKKLHPGEKQALDEALRAIAANPEIGEMKKGDLAGVQVYKCRAKAQLVLLAYLTQEPDISFTPHIRQVGG